VSSDIDALPIDAPTPCGQTTDGILAASGSPTNRRAPIVASFDGLLDGGLLKVTSRRGWPVLTFVTKYGETIRCALKQGNEDIPVYLEYELEDADR
jgi:hypothetical protein